MYRTIALCLLIGAMIASLVNLPVFGTQTLAAYFPFCLLATASGLWLIGWRSFFTEKSKSFLPDHFLIFLLLPVFAVIQATQVGHFNLVHYYWLAAAVFLFALYAWNGIYPAFGRNLLKAIVCMALLECVVVTLQFLGCLQPEDNLFRCTGTWVNPNVTALFLAMAFYAVLKPRLFRYASIQAIIAIAVIVAIAMLQCRTAFLVLLLFSAGRYGRQMMAFCRQRLGMQEQVFFAVSGILIVLFVTFFAFGIKQASTSGRWQIWNNCLPLIAEKPIFGHGFGQFEKDYNFFVSAKPLPSVDHVNMPYNDLLELAVEGGICAVLLWGIFLVVMVRFAIRNNRPWIPILAFIIIQFVSFGIQAIPVFALLCIYISTEIGGDLQVHNRSWFARIRRPVRSLVFYALPLVGFFLGLRQLKLAKAFYENSVIERTYSASEAVVAFSELDEQLNGYQRYQEAYGDACLHLGGFRTALAHYLAAAGVCSEPGVLSKCGYCYELEKKYDSSRYYYTLVQNMRPDLVGPRMALLNLYRREGDSALIRQKASEIAGMRVKVKNLRSDTMQLIARKILEYNETK
jgi:O-antigen ligase